MIHFSKIKKKISNPWKAGGYFIAIMRGTYYKAKYSVLYRKKVTIGKKFLVRGKLLIRGPGKVVIGDNVFIDGRMQPVTPFTHDKEAVISIGSNSFINGTRFGCKIKIAIGNFAIIGDARIMDTDFHSIYPNRNDAIADVKSGPIEIEENVWIGGAAAILKGVKIGKNSVVGFAAVVSNSVVSNCVVGGNPAKVIRFLDEK